MSDEFCTPKHAERLKALHDRDPNFGVIGYLWAPRVAAYMEELDCHSILDYGCGRSNLVPQVVERLHLAERPVQKRQEYDPATAPGTPEPADFVTCIDVLEHVEAVLLDNVLRDLQRCMLKAALITVSLRVGSPKKKSIHPNVHPREWWLKKIALEVGRVEEVPILNPEKAKSEVAMFVRPYDEIDL